MAAYISDLAQPSDDRAPRAVATINRQLAAISQAHQVAGYTNPTRDALVREAMRGIRRILGVAPDKKRAVTTADIRTAVTRTETRQIDIRDRMVLLLGFASGMRRSRRPDEPTRNRHCREATHGHPRLRINRVRRPQPATR